MAYIETELANYKARASALRESIAGREEFLARQTGDRAEADRLHGEVMENDRRELANLVELIAKQEAAIAESNAEITPS